MKLSLSCILILFSARLAFAGADWGLNQIVGYVDIAERRLNEGDAKNARANLKSARAMMPEASAAAKSDRGWPALESRIARLDKVIAAQEASAAKSDGAVEKLRQADKNELHARLAAQSDDYDKAAAMYQECSAGLEQALAVDPEIGSRKGPGGLTHAELVVKCKQGSAEMAKMIAGAGQGAAETEPGKAALAGYALAQKAMDGKKVPALEMAAALKGAEACKANTSRLTSIYNRNNKKLYDGKTSKLGDATIDELNAKCTKLEIALKAKPAFGCGRHYVSVSQWRSSVHVRWGAVQASPKSGFEAMDCSEMPKRSSFPGASASFKAKYLSACGADAVYVIQHNKWLESALQRQMSGECWKKGSLSIER